MKFNKQVIPVTKPELPPLEEFTSYLNKIWDNKILSNNGPFHQELEKNLSAYLGVEHISLFSNGTLALITALQVLDLTGEIITTPFSFVASSHALIWNNCTPVFADIDEDTFTIDPVKVEKAITDKTSAILAVHVYGNPCHVEELQRIADKYNLKLIYDAAHAFGVRINEQSILNFGDLSILSFHATKVFNTLEGGAIICKDKKVKDRIDRLKNFGFVNEVMVGEVGLNAKMNEFQAAFGLVQLNYVKDYIAKRKEIAGYYNKILDEIPGIKVYKPAESIDYTYTYYPILVEESEYGKSRDHLYNELKKNNIYARRYFYPLISSFPMYKNLVSATVENLPVANKIADKILCLPIYSNLQFKEIDFIVDIVKKR